MKKIILLAASLVLSASAMAQTVVIRDNDRDHRDNRAVVVQDHSRHNDRPVIVKEVHTVKVVDNNHHPRVAHRLTQQEVRHLRKHARYMSLREQRQHERMHLNNRAHSHRY